MHTSDIYQEFTRFLTPKEGSQVLAAVRQDRIIWQRMQQPDFLEQAIQWAGQQISRWSPGHLALLALKVQNNADRWLANPSDGIDPALIEPMMRVLQNSRVNQSSGPDTLEEAGLLALALIERRHKAGNWNFLTVEIQKHVGVHGEVHPGWKCAIACLCSLVTDSDIFLRALLPTGVGKQTFEWLVHARMCQPYSSQDHIEAFTALLKGQSLEIQLGVLRNLNLHGYENLVHEIASSLVVDHPAFTTLRSQTGYIKPTLSLVATRVFILQQLSALYQLSGNRIQAASLIHSAETALRHWEAGLYLQEINLDSLSGVSNSNIEPEKLASIIELAPRFAGELGAVIGGFASSKEALQKLPSNLDDPVLQIREAVQLALQQGDNSLAQELACQAVAKLIDKINGSGLPFWSEFVYEWEPRLVLKDLNGLGLHAEALNLADAFIMSRPTDIDMIHEAGIICQRMNNLAGALSYAQTAVGLDPENLEWRRWLGHLWMESGESAKAMLEFETILTLSPQVVIEDKLAYAQAALSCNELQRVINSCEAILNQTPDHGFAASLLGRALAAQGDFDRALSCLGRATLYAPEDPSAWLALANIQRDHGDSQRALETLRSAVLAIVDTAPGGVETNLTLGELCLQKGMVAEALPVLKRAYTLEPNNYQAGYLYGKALFENGDLSEARSILSTTRQVWATHREIAYCFALVAREMHDLEGMLSALEIALRPCSSTTWKMDSVNGTVSNQPETAQTYPLEWSLLYIRLLMGDLSEFNSEAIASVLAKDIRLYRAEQATQQILDQVPAHYEGRFYQAQILLEKGETGPAMAQFQTLAEIQSVPEHELYWRVQWGIGRAALSRGLVDTGLAALKEACQLHPGSLGLQRDLAEGYLRVELPQEALVAAQYALQLAPDHVENLVWYSEFVLPLGERRAALEALDCAVQLDPARYDLRAKLAELLIASGNLAAGRSQLDELRLSKLADQASLRKAADAYLKLGDVNSALECLENALEGKEPPSFNLLRDVASLNEKLGREERALTIIQQALADPSCNQARQSIPLYLLQADLLSRANRVQAALTSLEKGLRVAEDLIQAGLQDDTHLLDQDIAAIHEQFSNLLIGLGNLPEAFYHAEKSLEFFPDRSDLRIKAVSLALSTLQLERAVRLTEKITTGDNLLICLKAEVELEYEPGLRSGLPLLEAEIDHSLIDFPNDPRLMAAKSRLLVRRGEWLQARQVFARLSELISNSRPQPPSELWLAEASLEVQNWEAALLLFEEYTNQNPNDARGFFALSRALVKRAEFRRLCDMLDCRSKAPEQAALSEFHYQKFELAIQNAARLSNQQGTVFHHITRWKARGQAVFQPSMQAARDLASIQQTPQDTAALVSVLGLLKGQASVNQAAQRYPQAAVVRMQVAISCIKSSEPESGLDIARSLTQEQPANPIYQALRARLAVLVGHMDEGLEAYEIALKLWPDEAGWHDIAGDLAYGLDRSDLGLMHRERAFEIEPNNVDFALKLGEGCLSGDVDLRAVEVLETATHIDKNRLDVWLMLSRAYRKVGRLVQALDAALNASQVDPTTGKGHLYAAEISLALGQGEQALTYARSAYLREPENSSIILFLAQLLDTLGKASEAVKILEDAPLVIRDQFDVVFERARLIYRLKGAQPVLEILERLAVENPEEPDVLAFLAFAQNEVGQFEHAERNGFKSLRLNPNQAELAFMLGRLQHKAGQLDQAVYLFSEVIRMTPERLEPYLDLSTVYQERRETAQALQILRQAIRVAPGDYRAYYQSGLLLRDSKDYADAEIMLRRAVELAKDNAGIRRQLLAVIALNLVHNKQEVGSIS